MWTKQGSFYTPKWLQVQVQPDTVPFLFAENFHLQSVFAASCAMAIIQAESEVEDDDDGSETELESI